MKCFVVAPMEGGSGGGQWSSIQVESESVRKKDNRGLNGTCPSPNHYNRVCKYL